MTDLDDDYTVVAGAGRFRHAPSGAAKSVTLCGLTDARPITEDSDKRRAVCAYCIDNLNCYGS